MSSILESFNKTEINKSQLLQTAKQVIATEQQAIAGLIDSINDDFIKACELLINCQSRIVVTGVGKSGHIGSKIAASFASLGSPSFFLHAAEALHGDIGMITKGDVVLALSYSGTTSEIINLMPSLKSINVPIISITGNPHSNLALASDIHLPIFIQKEACHLNLAPTASTTATLALGDALTIAVTKAKQFSAEDFARSHPGGNLGRRLLLKVSDIMLQGDNLATATPETKFTDALVTMTSKGLGMLAITNANNEVVGIFTDGDLRRLLNNASKKNSFDITELLIKDIMNANYLSTNADTLAVDAWQTIKTKKINGLLVINTHNQLIGMLNIHTLTNAKII